MSATQKNHEGGPDLDIMQVTRSQPEVAAPGPCCLLVMATYGEEVEAFLNADTALSSSPVATRLMQDEQNNSDMLHRDQKAEIPSSLAQDLKDSHANAKPSNIGPGVGFNDGNRYQQYVKLLP
jgi:hypothetical protein